jgi:hypothetical protein
LVLTLNLIIFHLMASISYAGGFFLLSQLLFQDKRIIDWG